MNASLLAAALILAAAPAFAQGFAGLGTDAEGFALPERGTELTFPEDHGPHPGYRIEWWYLTANLEGADGRDYGIQWTLFRSALAPETGEGWDTPQIWIGHMGLTTPEAHYHDERFARGGIGHAGVMTAPFDAWIDEWAMTSTAADGDPLDALRLSASSEEVAYDLALTAKGPLVLHGDAGYSVKSESGQASYYYSQPHYTVTGTLTLPETEVEVTGTAWLDREWSSQPLDPDQTGWDWVSLHFDDGAKLMGFRLRSRNGGAFTSGTWITAEGRAAPFSDGTLRLTPQEITEVAGREVPTGWSVALPDRGLDVTLEAVNPQAWMGNSFGYWEGPVRIEGSHPGMGYLEMTGYE